MSDKVYDVVRLAGQKIDLCVKRTDDAALEQYLNWMNDEEFIPYLARNNRITDLGEEQNYVNKSAGERDYQFSIVEKGSRRLVGNCGFTVSRNWQNGNLGICIGEKDCWNKGYGTEAIKMMIRYCFNELNLHRVSLSVAGNNPRAQKCYKKAGMIECGRAHEHLFVAGKWVDLVYMEILNPFHKGWDEDDVWDYDMEAKEEK